MKTTLLEPTTFRMMTPNQYLSCFEARTYYLTKHDQLIITLILYCLFALFSVTLVLILHSLI